LVEKCRSYKKFLGCIFAAFHVVQSLDAVVARLVDCQKIADVFVPLLAELSVKTASVQLQQLRTETYPLLQVGGVVPWQQVDETGGEAGADSFFHSIHHVKAQ